MMKIRLGCMLLCFVGAAFGQSNTLSLTPNTGSSLDLFSFPSQNFGTGQTQGTDSAVNSGLQPVNSGLPGSNTNNLGTQSAGSPGSSNIGSLPVFSSIGGTTGTQNNAFASQAGTPTQTNTFGQGQSGFTNGMQGANGFPPNPG